RVGDGAHHERLRKPRHAHEQRMTAGEQRHQDLVDGVALPHDPSAHLRPQLTQSGDQLFFVVRPHSSNDRTVGGTARRLHYTASDRLVKLKSRAFTVGMTTSPPPSVPANRMAGPIASMLLSMNSGESLKRKLRTAFVTLPFSMRKTPSRVRPVYIAVRGSTSRRYHSRVMSRPRGVEAIISSVLVGPPIIFTVVGNPVAVLFCFFAQNRE